MATPRITFIYQLMLVMLLLNLTLTFGSSDGTNQLGQFDDFTLAKNVNDVANSEVRDALQDPYAEHAALDPDDGVTAAREPDTATAKTNAEVKPTTAPHSDSTSPTMTVSPYTFSSVISALPVAPTTLATHGVPGTPVRDTTVGAKTVDRKHTTTALPCVTTLATYGMSLSGSPSLAWTLTATVCPTTLVTMAKNVES